MIEVEKASKKLKISRFSEIIVAFHGNHFPELRFVKCPQIYETYFIIYL